MAYESYEDDSAVLDPSSPFYLDHVTRYWWASTFVQGGSVLDCACGHGYGTYILSKVADSALGVDLNVGSLAEAKEVFVAPNLSYIEFDIHELAKLERRFDVVTAFEVIEHIPPETTDSFLRALAMLLKPGGRLLLSTPNHDVVLKSGVSVPDFHINNFPSAALREVLRRHFGEVEMYGQYKRRSALAELVFDFDFFNLRHVVTRRLGGAARALGNRREANGPTDAAVTNVAASNKTRDVPDIKGVRKFYESPPAEMSEYVFSRRHWRQAGLTVARCARPLP